MPDSTELPENEQNRSQPFMKRKRKVRELPLPVTSATADLSDLESRYPKTVRFASQTDGGRLCWTLMQNPAAIIAMAIYANCGFPPICAVALLIQRYWQLYGAEERPWDSFKQHAGKLICVAMEKNGYELTGKSKEVGIPGFGSWATYQLKANIPDVTEDEDLEPGPLSE